MHSRELPAKDLLAINPAWQPALDAADNQELLQAILRYLYRQRELGLLNNAGIPCMVRGYFYEMACVIAEAACAGSPARPFFMVNDNVRYAGASISVDLIFPPWRKHSALSWMKISVLPYGTTAASNMGQHGREALRKCVYIWRRV